MTCQVDCKGLYADVDMENSTSNENIKDRMAFESLIKSYEAYKSSHVENMILSYDKDTESYTAEKMAYHPLQVVQIYFSTATFDHIVNDVSVTFGDQISAIDACLHSSLLHSELKIVFLLLYLIIQFIVT